jgi:hypothetical protein
MEDLVKEIVCLCDKIEELEERPVVPTQEITHLCNKVEELEERPAVAIPPSVKASKVKLEKPELYDGTKGALCGFLTKLRAYFLHCDDDFSYEFTKALSAANCLTGDILEWFEPTLRDHFDYANTPEKQEDGTKKIFSKYQEFETAIKEAFTEVSSKAKNTKVSNDICNCKEMSDNSQAGTKDSNGSNTIAKTTTAAFKPMRATSTTTPTTTRRLYATLQQP